MWVENWALSRPGNLTTAGKATAKEQAVAATTATARHRQLQDAGWSIMDDNNGGQGGACKEKA